MGPIIQNDENKETKSAIKPSLKKKKTAIKPIYTNTLF
jgi:hypothetical protein